MVATEGTEGAEAEVVALRSLIIVRTGIMIVGAKGIRRRGPMGVVGICGMLTIMVIMLTGSHIRGILGEAIVPTEALRGIEIVVLLEKAAPNGERK